MTSAIHLLPQTLAESLSYLAYPRPFKNPSYTKNANRRTKNLKTVLTQERERERVEREKHRQARDDRMDIDSGDVKTEEDQDEQTQAPVEEELPSCKYSIIYVKFVSKYVCRCIY